MTDKSTYNNNINNIGLLPIKNEFINMNNMNQFNNNANIQLNNYNNNLSQNIENNLNMNNFLLLKANNNVPNINLNSPRNINNYNTNQKNIIFNSGQNNYYNNLNNNYYQNQIANNNNKQMKLYLTSKHLFFSSPSLTKVNDFIYKDFAQIEKIFTNYKFYITNNNYEAINICLKYIEFSNFFFDQNITNKISDIINKIIFSNNPDETFKYKLKEVFQNMIPFNIRENYLREFFNPKGAKNLYNLFKKDLNIYKNEKDKIFYLFKIYEIVKNNLMNKDSEEIAFILHKFGANNSNININSYNNNSYFNEMSSNKNGGNYLNVNNYNHNNNNYNKYRKHSFQSQGFNWNESNYDNKNYNNNNNHHQHINYNNNYLEDKNNDELGFNKTYNNSYNKKNNYKGSYSSRHYYNDKNMHKMKNKSNRKNSNYGTGAVLVEVSTTPKKEEEEENIDDNENGNNNNNEITQDKKDELKNNILESNENIINDKKEENDITDLTNTNEAKKEEENNLINEVNISHDENQENHDNQENINNDNNVFSNPYINSDGNEENINEDNDNNENGYDLKDENIITDFNSINPFNDNNKEIDKSEENEDSTNNLKAINNPHDLEKSDLNQEEENENENDHSDNNNFILNIMENSENIFNNMNLYENGNDINKEENINEHYADINNKENENEGNEIHINYNTDNEDKIEDIENKNEINIEPSPKKELIYSNSANNLKEGINMTKIKSQDPNENRIINSNSNQNDLRSISDNNLMNLNKNSLNNAINNININDNIQQNNLNNNMNISNEQLQSFRMLMQNNNSLFNLYPFFNQNLQKNNLNNNILANANNLGMNIMNNINTGMNLLNLINDASINNQNNQIYFQNIENQKYINIFLNYLDEEKNLISVLRQNSNKKNNQYIHNHQTNIDFLKIRNDICTNEYNTKLKKLKENNPLLVKENMALFEEKIILPVYQKIQEEIEQRKDIYRDTYAKYKNIIMKVLEKNNVKDTKIEPYGSIVNNFMTEFGDIDVCISPSDHNLFKDFDKYLQEIREEAVEEQKCAKFIILEQYSKFFILKLKDIETEIDLDITVQYILPIINTKLIRLYSLYDQRFHILGIFLKFWVKKNHIHGALDKFLSSYALLILIIHYLQTIIEPRVLPILQQIHNVKKEYVYHNGEEEKITNLYFEEDFDEIHKYMEIINSQTQNELTVVELLVGFFEYYSYIYNHYFISISRSDKIPADENETIAFPIEDPFDIGYNPGKSMKINTLSYTAFVYCMKKELNNIISGEYFKHYKEE